MQSSKCSNSHNWHLLSSNLSFGSSWKKYLERYWYSQISWYSPVVLLLTKKKNSIRSLWKSKVQIWHKRPETNIRYRRVYSAEEKNPFCLVNWFEVNGVECYLNGVENDLYNDRADYSYDWGEIIISSATLPVKNNITIRPNLSGKERKIRIGLNCFKYDYRILDIIQRSNESKP